MMVSKKELTEVAQWLHNKRHDLNHDDTLFLICQMMEDLEDQIMVMADMTKE